MSNFKWNFGYNEVYQRRDNIRVVIVLNYSKYLIHTVKSGNNEL